jgi:hypothetical protein
VQAYEISKTLTAEDLAALESAMPETEIKGERYYNNAGGYESL